MRFCARKIIPVVKSLCVALFCGSSALQLTTSPDCLSGSVYWSETFTPEGMTLSPLVLSFGGVLLRGSSALQLPPSSDILSGSAFWSETFTSEIITLFPVVPHTVQFSFAVLPHFNWHPLLAYLRLCFFCGETFTSETITRSLATCRVPDYLGLRILLSKSLFDCARNRPILILSVVFVTS